MDSFLEFPKSTYKEATTKSYTYYYCKQLLLHYQQVVKQTFPLYLAGICALLDHFSSPTHQSIIRKIAIEPPAVPNQPEDHPSPSQHK
jgi:hypothetical protein